MPAIDSCEPQVIRALEKDGWYISSLYQIRYGTGRKYFLADLLLQKHVGDTLQEVAVIEVKCFDRRRRSQWDELYIALGQYITYRAVLQTRAKIPPLFMAIPKRPYERLFQLSFIQRVRTEIDMKLIVVDLDKEEIVTWIG